MIILESERLLFREHEPRDLEAYCAIEADPEVRRYVAGTPRARKDAERKFRNVVSVHIMEKLGFTLIGTEKGVRSFHNFQLVNPF